MKRVLTALKALFLFWFLSWWETKLQKVKTGASFPANYIQSTWKARDVESFESGFRNMWEKGLNRESDRSDTTRNKA